MRPLYHDPPARHRGEATGRLPVAVALLAATLVLAGCRTRPITVAPEAMPDPLPPPARVFADGFAGDAPLPDPTERGSIDSPHGCELHYEYYAGQPRPTDESSGGTLPAPLVVLAHGFQRDLAFMRGWAAEWSLRGVGTVIVNFCNSSLFAGRHDRNADDLVALAAHLRPAGEPVLYAGFSAGGLAALLAASADERAVAYLGLDPVDSGGLAERVRRLGIPALFLFGEPAACNARGNLVPVIPRARPLIAARVRNAGHCSFEEPTNGFCRSLCGDVEPVAAEVEVRRTIRALATGWIITHLGAEPASRSLFDRRTLESLEEAGRIALLALE